MLFENISLPSDVLATTKIELCDGVYTVSIVKDPNINAASLDQEIVPSQQDSYFLSHLTRSKVSSITDTILNYDAQLRIMFKRGDTVTVTVPDRPPRSVVWHNDLQEPEGYSRSRCRIGDFIRPALIQPPDLSYLKLFQEQGVDWLLKTDRALLGDDMGLGKTVQAISALRRLFNEGAITTALIIAPGTLCRNWSDELFKWAPELSQVKLSPGQKNKTKVWEYLLGRVHVILSNYEHFRSMPPVLKEQGVDVLIFDEAHHVRNEGSQVTQGVREIKSKHLWALSGTPLERDEADITNLLILLEPTRYSRSLNNLPVSSIRSHLRKYLLRRKKSDVLEYLPEVSECKIALELTDNQKMAYNDALTQSRSNSDQLALVNELRTICDFVSETYEGSDVSYSAKADHIMKIISSIVEANEKGVIFSYLLEPLKILEHLLNISGQSEIYEVLTGDKRESDRNTALDNFKTDPDKRILLCSTRLGGEGLNLTHANHVIYFNEWWNPSSNRQARDRVVRIGQEKPVYVYTFRCKGTLEDSYDALLDGKEATEKNLVDRLAVDESHVMNSLNTIVKELREV